MSRHHLVNGDVDDCVTSQPAEQMEVQIDYSIEQSIVGNSPTTSGELCVEDDPGVCGEDSSGSSPLLNPPRHSVASPDISPPPMPISDHNTDANNHDTNNNNRPSSGQMSDTGGSAADRSPLIMSRPESPIHCTSPCPTDDGRFRRYRPSASLHRASIVSSDTLSQELQTDSPPASPITIPTNHSPLPSILKKSGVTRRLTPLATRTGRWRCEDGESSPPLSGFKEASSSRPSTSSSGSPPPVPPREVFLFDPPAPINSPLRSIRRPAPNSHQQGTTDSDRPAHGEEEEEADVVFRRDTTSDQPSPQGALSPNRYRAMADAYAGTTELHVPDEVRHVFPDLPSTAVRGAAVGGGTSSAALTSSVVSAAAVGGSRSGSSDQRIGRRHVWFQSNRSGKRSRRNSVVSSSANQTLDPLTAATHNSSAAEAAILDRLGLSPLACRPRVADERSAPAPLHVLRKTNDNDKEDNGRDSSIEQTGDARQGTASCRVNLDPPRLGGPRPGGSGVRGSSDCDRRILQQHVAHQSNKRQLESVAEPPPKRHQAVLGSNPPKTPFPPVCLPRTVTPHAPSSTFLLNRISRMLSTAPERAAHRRRYLVRGSRALFAATARLSGPAIVATTTARKTAAVSTSRKRAGEETGERVASADDVTESESERQLGDSWGTGMSVDGSSGTVGENRDSRQVGDEDDMACILEEPEDDDEAPQEREQQLARSSVSNDELGQQSLVADRTEMPSDNRPAYIPAPPTVDYDSPRCPSPLPPPHIITSSCLSTTIGAVDAVDAPATAGSRSLAESVSSRVSALVDIPQALFRHFSRKSAPAVSSQSKEPISSSSPAPQSTDSPRRGVSCDLSIPISFLAPAWSPAASPKDSPRMSAENTPPSQNHPPPDFGLMVPPLDNVSPIPQKSSFSYLPTPQHPSGWEPFVLSPTSTISSIPKLTDIASASMGAKVLFATDEFYACAGNMLKPNPPQATTKHNEETDGWETRRRRRGGFDYCLIQLGRVGTLRGIDVNTNCMGGKAAPKLTVQAAYCPDLEEQMRNAMKGGDDLDMEMMAEITGKVGRVGTGVSEKCREWFDKFLTQRVKWKDIMQEEFIDNDDDNHDVSRNMFEICASARSQDSEETRKGRYTHIKLSLLPDGGIARFRLFGEIDILEDPTSRLKLLPPPHSISPLLSTRGATSCVWGSDIGALPFEAVQTNYRDEVDLADAANGALCLCWSDDHYGRPSNLLMPGNEGWETARNISRPPVLVEDKGGGSWLFPDTTAEWVVIKLGGRGKVRRIVVETKGYGGSYPESLAIDGWDGGEGVVLDVLCQMRYFQQAEAARDVNNRHHNNRDRTRGSSSRVPKGVEWKRLVMRSQLEGDAVHEFDSVDSTCTHLRMRIFPDGGISRLKVWGVMDKLMVL
eukprot:GHVS01025670.1.p1 GENE.GHVS01025670.1~~GHVS01025670.1.p1  ORF type:complete len:1398 (+),score=260.21 GHVS01025670.1:327-4520(+)